MKYTIGVDGGGTKTLALLADLDGNILARGLGGASNFNAVGFAAACVAIETAITAAFISLAEQGQVTLDFPTYHLPISALCLGLAGAGRPEDAAQFSAWAREKFSGAALKVVSDAEILLAAGAPSGPALALICGTGSIAYGRTEAGELVRAGGWGYLFGDEGSGFALGAAALRAVMRAYDGRGQPTRLTDLILARYGLTDPQGLVKNIYGAEDPRAEIAGLADLVERAASQNDPVAHALLDEAAQELAHAVQAVYRKLGTVPVPLALTGGILLNSAQFSARFRAVCRRLGLEFSAIDEIPEPATGALRLARAICA